MSPPVRWPRLLGAWTTRRDVLRPRHVVLLDETGMTPDADVAELLGAVEAAGARADRRGRLPPARRRRPGGALEALARRHPGHVWALTRQPAPA